VAEDCTGDLVSRIIDCGAGNVKVDVGATIDVASVAGLVQASPHEDTVRAAIDVSMVAVKADSQCEPSAGCVFTEGRHLVIPSRSDNSSVMLVIESRIDPEPSFRIQFNLVNLGPSQDPIHRPA